jgi:hypothetical protein
MCRWLALFCSNKRGHCTCSCTVSVPYMRLNLTSNKRINEFTTYVTCMVQAPFYSFELQRGIDSGIAGVLVTLQGSF